MSKKILIDFKLLDDKPDFVLLPYGSYTVRYYSGHIGSINWQPKGWRDDEDSSPWENVEYYTLQEDIKEV